MSYYSSEEIGNAFKILAQRLREESERQSNFPPEPLLNNCCNCRFRHEEEYYDQQWGRFFIGHNWCDKDRSLMDTGTYNSLRGKGHEFISDCPYYEEGEGIYDKIPAKEREKLPH